METEKFIDLVRRMREAQKEYFRTRDRKVMLHAMMLENTVDNVISEHINKQKPQQPEQLTFFNE